MQRPVSPEGGASHGVRAPQRRRGPHHGQPVTGPGSTLPGVSAGRPEPLTAAPELLLAELRELQRTHRVATHEVLDGRRVDVDPETLAWWRLAYDCWMRAERERYAGSV